MSESTLSHVEPAPSSRWLNVQQAAQHIGVGPGLVYRACASRRLRHVRVGDRRHGLLRFRIEWLDAYMESCAAGAEIVPLSKGQP